MASSDWATMSPFVPPLIADVQTRSPQRTPSGNAPLPTRVFSPIAATPSISISMPGYARYGTGTVQKAGRSPGSAAARCSSSGVSSSEPSSTW